MSQENATGPKASLLLLSGGVGKRSLHHEPKQFYELGGHPVIALSIIAAVKVPGITEILINAPEGYEERTREIMQAYAGKVPFRVLPAGETRQDSSRILTEAAQNDIVILHEAARPLITSEMFQELLSAEDDNIGYTQKIPFSMCTVDDSGQITGGVSRDNVYNVQLPQRFARDVLLKAHAEATQQGRSYSEDAVMCIEMAGAKVQSIEGPSSNIKITNWDDFIIAQQISQRLKK